MITAALTMALLAATPTQKEILGELERLDRNLANAEVKLHDAEARRIEIQRGLTSTETERAAATLRKAEAFERFSLRVRALARMPAGARLVLLGGSRSLSDYLETTRVLRWVAAHDRELHRHFISENKRLTELEASMKARRQELKTLEATFRSERDTLATSRRERIDLLKSVLETTAVAARAARERRAARRALSGMVRKLSPAGKQSRKFSRNRRRLPWPAEGPVDVPFGRQIEQGFGTVTTQNGLDIRSTVGTRVQAIAPGRVVYAGWLRGYGRMVIIDHGENYHTLSAHLGALNVKVDEEVAQGAAIGVVGDTGSLRGTVLYFEIRHKGAAIDPALWLR